MAQALRSPIPIRSTPIPIYLGELPIQPSSYHSADLWGIFACAVMVHGVECGSAWICVWCGVAWCGVMRCGAVRCGAVWSGVVRCGVVWSGAVRYGTVRYGVRVVTAAGGMGGVWMKAALDAMGANRFRQFQKLSGKTIRFGSDCSGSDSAIVAGKIWTVNCNSNMVNEMASECPGPAGLGPISFPGSLG